MRNGDRVSPHTDAQRWCQLHDHGYLMPDYKTVIYVDGHYYCPEHYLLGVDMYFADLKLKDFESTANQDKEFTALERIKEIEEKGSLQGPPGYDIIQFTGPMTISFLLKAFQVMREIAFSCQRNRHLEREHFLDTRMIYDEIDQGFEERMKEKK